MLFVADEGGNISFLFTFRLGKIDDKENDVGAVKSFFGAFYDDFFDDIPAFAYTGGVGKIQAYAVQFYAFAEDVPRGAGNVADDGAVGLNEGV